MLAIDHNILYYTDAQGSIEINVSAKQYGDQKTLIVECDCQGKDGDEYYPLVFLTKKEIADASQLQQTIFATIQYISSCSDRRFAPREKKTVADFADQMAKLYLA